MEIGREDDDGRGHDCGDDGEDHTRLPHQNTQSTTISSTTVRHRQQQRMVEMTHFWSILRMKLIDWDTRLDQSVTSVDSAVVTTTAATDVDEQLDDLKTELTALRNKAIAVASGETIWEDNKGEKLELGETTGDEIDCYNTQGNMFQLSTATDWRLLHDELSKYATKFEEKTKNVHRDQFLFRRYRVELARRRRRNRQMMEATTAAADGATANDIGRRMNNSSLKTAMAAGPFTSSVEASNSQSVTLQSCLKDLFNVQIMVGASGNVTVQSQQQDQTPSAIPLTIRAGTPLHLWNLTGCHVTVQLQPLPALYLIGLTETTVIVSSSVASAVHITDCHKSVLQMVHVAQQMRIHKSNQLSINLSQPWTQGAIIMEDSKQLEFQVQVSTTDSSDEAEEEEEDKSNNAYHHLLDVKDFNWLRTGIPSPNFTVTTVIRGSGKNDDDDNQNQQSATTSPTTLTTIDNFQHGVPPPAPVAVLDDPTAVPAPADDEENDDDDDDDEL
jgi:Tubulin binding cofactor C